MSEATKSIRDERNPKIMYAIIEENKYKSELDIFDRWQSFMAEMLRLSLLGIAIFGFLFKEVFLNSGTAKNPNPSFSSIKQSAQWSLTLFAVSTVCALFYRYGSTEAMLHYLRGLRNPLKKRSELTCRDWWLISCLVCKIISAVSLGSGAVLSAYAFLKLLSAI